MIGRGILSDEFQELGIRWHAVLICDTRIYNAHAGLSAVLIQSAVSNVDVTELQNLK